MIPQNNHNKKIINKVKHLLELAKNNPEDEEGQSAFLMAQRLMLKHSISDKEIENEVVGDSQLEINSRPVTLYKRVFWWEKQLGTIIADNFRVKIYYSLKKEDWNGQTKTRMMFYGTTQDLELAVEMYSLAYDAVRYYYNRYLNKVKSKTDLFFKSSQVKSSYIRGFLEGLEYRFNEQIRDLKNKYELVALIPEEVESEYQKFSSNFRRASQLKIPEVTNNMALQIGYNEARKIDLTRSTIEESSGQN
ncbi:DUF2786 domain-containing protein [Pediococcus pentosaceus]|uniref:DUF2786 domain-containing protein n=1 Tax=Pediococcus pentosaceus TaxID=1255 RepID=UPI0021A85708|nr:DUF2786 domain-containing protein [Pediococcus pentosaceus]MCT3019871.1 DUF2786 domain-containing protein [Pediococcus pentosaceus]